MSSFVQACWKALSMLSIHIGISTCVLFPSISLPIKKRGVSLSLTPLIRFVRINLCSSMYQQCVCRGQRQSGGCFDKHPIDEHGHRHHNTESDVFLLHMLILFSRYCLYIPITLLSIYLQPIALSRRSTAGCGVQSCDIYYHKLDITR